MIDSLLTGDFASAPTNIPAMVLGLLVAFAGGHAVAWVYMWTHSGLSYSKSFVNSLVVIPTVVSLVMMVLSNNLITAFGLMANLHMHICSGWSFVGVFEMFSFVRFVWMI